MFQGGTNCFVCDSVSCIQFPDVSSQFFVPEDLDASLCVQAEIEQVANGEQLFARVLQGSRFRVVLVTKVDDILALKYENGESGTTMIANTDFKEKFHLLAKTAFQLSLSLLPSNTNDLRFIQLPQHSPNMVNILVLSTNGKYLSFCIQLESCEAQIKVTGVKNFTEKLFVKNDYRQCNITGYIEENRKTFLCFQFCFDSDYIEELIFDLSDLKSSYKSAKSEQYERTERLIEQMGNKLFLSYSEASNNERKDNIFRQIMFLVSKEQSDLQKRKIGLQALQLIYSSGKIDIINQLWKECKNSFDYQPYNIIDIKELTLSNQLGCGTFGCVKQGIWISEKGSLPVAVKVIQDNSEAFDLADLRGEFVALSLLDHPNIITMHGGGFVKQNLGIYDSIHYFIVMELMEGNLSELIRDQYSELSLETKIDIAKQACAGISHLHHHKIIHRDIKPANVLYSENQGEFRIKIADLGIAKPDTGTVMRTAIGTHNYMAPEILNQPNRKVEFAYEVDIYSFGILLWELFTGRSAADFCSQSKKQTLFRSKSNKFPAHTPSWIVKLITKCTNSQPKKRLTSKQLLLILSGTVSTIPSLLSLSSGSIARQQDNSITPPTIYQTEKEAPIVYNGPYWRFKELEGSWKDFPCVIQNQIEKCFSEFSAGGKHSISILFTLEETIKHMELQFSNWEMKEKETHHCLVVQRVLHRPEVLNRFFLQSLLCKELDILIFTVTGENEEDCTSEIRKIVYTVLCNGKPISKALYNHPFTFEAPHKSGYISICIESKTNFFFSDFPLDKPMRKEIQLNDFSDNPLVTISNPSLDYNESQICIVAEIQKNMKIRADEILFEIIKLCELDISVISKESDMGYSMCSGISGYAYMLWKAGSSGLYKNQQFQCFHSAKRILSHCIAQTECKYNITSFLKGCSGYYAVLGAVLVALGETSNVSHSISELMNISDHFLVADMFDKDITLGLAGYMISLLFVAKHVPFKYYDLRRLKNILCKCFRLICDDYVFEETFAQHLGAAHGTAGLLFVLLHVKKLVYFPKYEHKIRNALHLLVENEKQEKSFFHSVNWSDGCSGILPTLLKAYDVYGDNKFLDCARRVAERIWKFGLVRTGFGLSCGISGCAYALLAMYQYTRDSSYLYYASQFSAASFDPRVILNIANYQDSQSQRCCSQSLMEGICGQASLCIDIQNPLSAAFPGYTNDIQSPWSELTQLELPTD